MKNIFSRFCFAIQKLLLEEIASGAWLPSRSGSWHFGITWTAGLLMGMFSFHIKHIPGRFSLYVSSDGDRMSISWFYKLRRLVRIKLGKRPEVTPIKYDTNSDDESLDKYWYLMYSNPVQWERLYMQSNEDLMPDGCRVEVRSLSKEEAEAKSPRAYYEAMRKGGTK